jgi:hypothetical protein
MPNEKAKGMKRSDPLADKLTRSVERVGLAGAELDEERLDPIQIAFMRAMSAPQRKDGKIALARVLRKEWLDGCNRRYLSESWLSTNSEDLPDSYICVLETYVSTKSPNEESTIISLGTEFGHTFLIINGNRYAYREPYIKLVRGGAPQ